MDRLVYVATTGLSNIEQAQAARANNLANVNTPGFRADLARAMSVEMVEPGYRARVYGVNEGAGVDLSSGTLVETGRSLDVAVKGDGLFAVIDDQGREAYTRAGAFHVNELGQLVTAGGQQVMGRGAPIAVPPYESIALGEDGVITVRPQGQGPEALVQVATLKLVNPEAQAIYKGSNGLLYGVEERPFDVAPEVRIESGVLESSNVSAIHELTEILSLARQFELEVRLMKTAETNDETATQLLRIT